MNKPWPPTRLDPCIQGVKATARQATKACAGRKRNWITISAPMANMAAKRDSAWAARNTVSTFASVATALTRGHTMEVNLPSDW